MQKNYEIDFSPGNIRIQISVPLSVRELKEILSNIPDDFIFHDLYKDPNMEYDLHFYKHKTLKVVSGHIKKEKRIIYDG